MLTTFAPAKINLYLHVTGRREDGYHLLDSLVAFAGAGDVLSLEEGGPFAFRMEGPMAASLSGEDSEKNLVVRAARSLAAALERPLDFGLALTKNLPVASGIGGGSADGAAALRLLAHYWDVAADAPLLYQLAAKLGQDVPCCLAGEPCYFRGIGDRTEKGPPLPETPLLLVNPNKPLPTPAVFQARSGPFQDKAAPMPLVQNAQELAAVLAVRENGLTRAALSLCPEIEEILSAIGGQKNCLLARMSGSGATCFGLFPSHETVKEAAETLFKTHPEWWIAATTLAGAKQ